MKTKICKKCTIEKPITEYNSGRDEFGTHFWCKGCVQKYDKIRHKKQAKKRRLQAKTRRNELARWFAEYKSILKCTRCPENHPACLDFHHTGNDKERNVSEMAKRGCSKETILAEIAKCEVVCANCHRKEHYNGV